MFEPIAKRKSLSGLVEAELTKAIQKGKYRPLEKIPTENELCSIFNVSRTVVREAVKGLNAKGIVDVRKGSGVYVSEMSIQNAAETLNLFFGLSSNQDIIIHTIDSRAMIEPIIAAQSANIRNDKHIAELKKNMEQMHLCALDNKVKEAELDNQFHRILLNCVDNLVISLLIDPIFNLTPKYKHNVFAKTISGDLKEAKEKMLYYHQKITDAVIAKQPHNAETYMREHIMVTRENYLNTTKS
ncbi:FadR family transcriptional regulator [Muricauda sp. 2012CJ35-5]|uniref:FadR family transcriptional regulator n=1 Tax=Flagellimonas spongiicola TaxID=2942208 RepID=A0ABT0PR19_9FLAO|nr:FadR/GntR family transcriptional regulator [Allomuricauda spongiicola]MCL6273736.1 FadR family transcriptional regulator [Allomuricauda spongiicola]